MDLTAYESDVEDSGTGLNWSVSGINTALFTAIITDLDNDIITFTPIANAHGSDIITLTLTDSGGLTATQDITITLTEVNDPPIFTSTPVTSATENSAYSYNITATDVDVGDSLTITGTPTWLTLTDNGDGTATLTGTPTNDDVGDHGVELSVTDSAGATDTQSFTINVSDTNDAPVITSTPVAAVDEDDTYTYTLTASDVDVGDELTLSAPTLPSWLSFAPETGTLSGTPTNDDVGDHHVVLRVNDGTVDVDQGFTITVSNTNDAPTISGTPATSVDEDKPYSFTPTANDVDVGDTLTFSITNKPPWASFDTNTGALTGTPDNDDVGTTSGIVITVKDAARASDSLDPFDLTVVNVNTDLEIQKTVDNLMPNIGDQTVFTITVTNNDPSDATGVQVTDMLPSGLDYVSDDSEGGYDPDTGIWNIGNLSATAPNNTVNLNITATVIQEGEIVNIASITDSEETDLDKSDNSSSLILNGGNQADLAIEKTVDNPTPNIGDTITFTITVRNNGLHHATGVQVTDVLPTDLTYQSSTPSQGTYYPDTGVWDVGDLNVGDSATLQLAVTVNSTDEIINTASISNSEQTDPDTTNNGSSEVINQDTASHPSIADLAVQKILNQDEANVGDEIVFSLVVRNNGPDDANSVQINDVLPDGLTYISSDLSQGSYDVETGIWDVGTISASSYVIMDIAVKLTDTDPQSNAASIGNLDEFDPNNGNDSDEATVTGQAAEIPEITSPTSGFYINASNYNAYPVSGTAEGLASVEIFADAASLGKTTALADSTWTIDVDFTPINEGTVNLTAVSGSITSDPVTGIYDKTAPSSTAIAPAYGNGTLYIIWTASDALSGVASTELWYKKDSGGTWANTGMAAQTGTSGTFPFTPAEGEGTYYFATRSTDNVSNAEAETSGDGDDSTIYDTVAPDPPAITTNSGNDYSTTDSSITLEGTCASDTVAIYVNDSTDGVTFTWGETSWAYTGTLESGANTFYITAEDAAGNVSDLDSITVTYNPTTCNIQGTRNLPKFVYSSSEGNPVSIDIDIIDEGRTPNGLIVKEYVPQGWEVSDVEPPIANEFDPEVGEMKWVFIGDDVKDRTIAYKVDVPAGEEEGTAKTFSGQLLYNDPVSEDPFECTLGGEQEVTLACDYNPHDINSDWVIGDFEILDAIDCWADVNCRLYPAQCEEDFYILDLIDLWAVGDYQCGPEGADKCFPWEIVP